MPTTVGTMIGRGGIATPAPYTTKPSPPDEHCWHTTALELEAARDECERKRHDLVAEKDAEVEQLRNTIRHLEVERDEAEQRAQVAEVEAMRRVHDVQWEASQRYAEYDDEVSSLKNLLEEERGAHVADVERLREKVRHTQEDADTRVEETRRECEAAVKATVKRARDAEELAADTVRRAKGDVAETRKREEARVQEVRRMADSRVRECEEKKRCELEQMREMVVQLQRVAGDRVAAAERHKADALDEATRHVDALEQDLGRQRLMEETELARQRGRLDEWRAMQRRQNDTVASHHKGLVDIEKTLHGRTMERTMDRVVRHWKLEDGNVRGRHTPTRAALASLQNAANSTMPNPASASPRGPPPISMGTGVSIGVALPTPGHSPLARAAATLITE